MKSRKETMNFILSLLMNNKDKYINSKMLLSNLHQNGFGKLDGSNLRHLLHDIRVSMQGGYIIADGKGYCYTQDKKKIQAYASDLARRIKSQGEILESAIKHYL